MSQAPVHLKPPSSSRAARGPSPTFDSSRLQSVLERQGEGSPLLQGASQLVPIVRNKLAAREFKAKPVRQPRGKKIGATRKAKKVDKEQLSVTPARRVKERSVSKDRMSEESPQLKARQRAAGLNDRDMREPPLRSPSPPPPPRARGSYKLAQELAERKIQSKYGKTEGSLPTQTAAMVKSHRPFSLQLAFRDIQKNGTSYQIAGDTYDIPRETVRRQYLQYKKDMGIDKKETLPSGRSQASSSEASSSSSSSSSSEASSGKESGDEEVGVKVVTLAAARTRLTSS